MLIELTVKNYRSFKESNTFSMVSSQGDELRKTNTLSSNVLKTPDLLRSAVIYGANSSGKSNLINVLGYLKFLVTKSTEFKPNQKIPTDVFMFDDESISTPTELNISFVAAVSSKVETFSTEYNSNNKKLVRYDYGVVFDKNFIIEEWLHSYPKGKVQEWFYRRRDEKLESDYEYSFSNLFKGSKSNWESNTRSNVLFLSNAVYLNSEQLKPVYDWFDNILQVGTDSKMYFGENFTRSVCDDESYKKGILSFLRSADIGIDDFFVEKKKLNVDDLDLPPDMPDLFKKKIIEQVSDANIIDLKSIRKVNGVLKYLDFDEESEGTKKLFALAGPIIDSLKEGNVLIIDELHNHLHPKLIEFLVKSFHNPEVNINNAQLIFTTHDTYMMKKDFFRRDQIWLVEKDHDYASHIYSLYDFSIRKDRGAEYEDQYLEGIFGATPFIDENYFFQMGDK
ncbi:AAA family ATPase [Psychrobacter sp. HII-4]|uniref:AAA family ATPase n=1 Tax=Psychrobacter sp. HII-4 TaxID=1569264 RepID=UPI001919EB6E|nr:ATP-binding protein [Psychrobacter sp. HII-4]